LEDSLTTRRFAKGGEAKKPEGESFFKQAYRRNIPVDARMYLETLLGNRTQVTEKDFTQNELSKIEEAIRRSQEYAQKNQESMQAEIRAARDLEQRLSKGRKEGARRLTSDPEWRKAAKIWDIENPTDEQRDKQWQSWTRLFERNKDLAVGEDLIALIGEKDPKKYKSTLTPAMID
jgi:ATPase subunit of ABC transporter with duplicated ATPase domains